MKTVGQYSPTSAQIFSFTEDILFPDGTADLFPDTLVIESDCPFPEDDSETFENGRILVFSICFFIALVTIIVTVLIWWKFWRRSLTKLTDLQEMSINDIVIMVIIVTDFFQYMAMGPDFSSLSGFISELGAAFSVDLGSLVEMKEGMFWLVLDVIITLCFTWLLLCLVVVKKIDIRFERFSI